MENRLSSYRLSRTATVYLTSNWITYTAARLIRTYTICKIIVESSKLICTVVAHPITTSSRANCKLNTIIYRYNTNSSIILVHIGICRDKSHKSSKSSKKSNNYFEHFYISDIITALSLYLTITNLIKPSFAISANNKAIRIKIVKSLNTINSIYWANIT